MSPEIVKDLAPSGTLRAAINMANFLLVTGRTTDGDPDGVSPDMARELARRLGVGIELLPYASPGEIADDAGTGAWDIGNIGAEPKRAEKIDFTAAYCEIQATYLVPAGSPIESIADVDRPGTRIAVSARSAYDLWLERNIKHAELVSQQWNRRIVSNCFVSEGLDALAGLRPPVDGGCREPGRCPVFSMVSSPRCKQAIGCTRGARGRCRLPQGVRGRGRRPSGFRRRAHRKSMGWQARLSVAPPAR